MSSEPDQTLRPSTLGQRPERISSRTVLPIAIASAVSMAVAAGTIAFGSVTPDFASWMFAFGYLAVALWALRLVLNPQTTWKKSPLHWAVLAFLVYTVIRYVGATVEYDARVELLHVVFYALVYFVCVGSFQHARERAIFLGTVAILAVGESIYSFWQVRTGADLVLHLSRDSGYHGRGSGTFICPNNLAGLLEMVIGLLAARLVFHRPRGMSVEKLVLRKVAEGFVLLIVLFGLVTTFSRGGWIVTASGAMLLPFLGEFRRRGFWLRVVASLLVLGALTFIAIRLFPQNRALRSIFVLDAKTDRPKVYDPSFGDRTPMWKSTWHLIQEHPVVGVGPAQWKFHYPQYRLPIIQAQGGVDYAHHDVLQLVAEYGVIGLCIVLIALGCFYWHAISALRAGASAEQKSFAAGAILAVTMIVLHSWVDFNLRIPSNGLFFVTLLGLTAALEDGRNRFPRVPVRPWARYGLAAALVGFCAWAGIVIHRTSMAFYLDSRGTDSKVVLHWDNAVDRFKRAMTLDPNIPYPAAGLAEIYMSKARLRRPEQQAEREELLRQAVTLLQRAVALNQFNPRYWIRLGEANLLLGKETEARVAYERAIEVDPVSSFVHDQAGRFFRRIGDDERARMEFNRSVELFADGPGIINLQEMEPPQPK